MVLLRWRDKDDEGRAKELYIVGSVDFFDFVELDMTDCVLVQTSSVASSSPLGDPNCLTIAKS